MSAAGLILAAGESRRMGTAKALLQYRGEAFLDHLIRSFAQHCSPLIVVLGHQADSIRPMLKSAHQAQFVINQDYQLGQFSSMQCGLRAIPMEVQGVLFTLVDHPNVEPFTLSRLLEQQDALLAIPRYQGRRGHPVFFSRQLISELLSLSPDGQARTIVNRHPDSIRYVDVDDRGILDDIDNPEDYQHFLKTVSL